MRRVARSIAVAILFAAPSVAFAQPKKPVPPPPPVAPPIHQSSLAQLSTEIAKALGDVPAGALVAASAVTSDIGGTKGDELALRVATLVAARLNGAHPHPQPASLAVARGASGRAASLVYVQLEIAKGELRATADLYAVVANGWERLRNPAPGPRAHGFVAVPLDAEIRTFLPAIPLEKAAVHKVKHEETDVFAVGCGDIDADGGLELVLASRSRVVVGKLAGNKLEIVKQAPWSQIASKAPVPLRDPLGSIVVRHGQIAIGTTDRGGVLVDASLVTRAQLTGLPLDDESCLVPSPELSSFDGSTVTCTKGEPSHAFPLPRFDAFASANLVDKTGGASTVLAARDAKGTLKLRRYEVGGKTTDISLEGAGPQIAIADLDLDGSVEIACSGDSSGEADGIVVWSWKDRLVPRLRYATKEPVRALATCPPEDKGAPALVAVVGSEVWLVR